MNARAVFPGLKRYRLMRRSTDPIMPSAPRPVRRDCHGRLIAALLAMAGEDSEMLDAALCPWASATFIGARHVVTLAIRGEDVPARAEQLADLLPEAEFAIPGHLVADLCVEAWQMHGMEEARFSLSILTIEAW